MNYEELVTCPYNKFHQIKKSRIQYHIIKCKKVMVLVFSPNYEEAFKLKDVDFLSKNKINYNQCVSNSEAYIRTTVAMGALASAIFEKRLLTPASFGHFKTVAGAK